MVERSMMFSKASWCSLTCNEENSISTDCWVDLNLDLYSGWSDSTFNTTKTEQIFKVRILSLSFSQVLTKTIITITKVFYFPFFLRKQFFCVCRNLSNHLWNYCDLASSIRPALVTTIQQSIHHPSSNHRSVHL